MEATVLPMIGGGDEVVATAAAVVPDEEEVEEREEERISLLLSSTRRVGEGEDPDSSERMPEMPESKLRLGRLRRTESEMNGSRRLCCCCCCLRWWCVSC
jgi:hypothetical protein